jgi:hypothetical protein
MKPASMNIFVRFSVLAATVSHCLAYEFTVEGEIRVRDYYRGELAHVTNYNFSAEIKDCSSWIRTFGGWHQSLEYQEFGWNGTNSYVRSKFWRDGRNPKPKLLIDGKVTQSPTNLVSKPANDAILYIYNTDMPKYCHGMQPIWLAYASPCHYNTRKSGDKIEPVWYMGPELPGKRQGYVSTWTMSESAPGLLNSMVDFADDLPPFDKEATNSVYSVTSWTNIAGMNIPRVFQVLHLIENHII